ncbi:MAG: ABC transporter permease [Acidobacteria bacterium]|nr:ABC transporter permease [Acidobacteriota bacterium]
MIEKMVINNVLHRPVRTLISIIAVGVEVMLVIVVVGLTSGLMQDTARRIEGVGADVMLRAPASGYLMVFSGAPMPIKIRDPIAQMKFVQTVAPVLFQFNSTGGLDLIYGIEKESFYAVSGGFVFHQGHDLESPDDILVDDWYAKAKKVKVGQTLHLLDHDFIVAGIVEHGKGARLYVSMQTLQEMSGSRDKASVFFVKCTRPEHTPAVMEQMRKIFPRHEITALKDYLSLMTSSNLPGLDAFIETMIVLAVIIGFLVIFLSMYTTIMERTRDIGVLKSLGASRGYIVKAILSESTLICMLGVLAGVGMSYGVRKFFIVTFPTLSILITPYWILNAAAIAVAGGLLGAAYPAWMASRKDPIEALAYE